MFKPSTIFFTALAAFVVVSLAAPTPIPPCELMNLNSTCTTSTVRQDAKVNEVGPAGLSAIGSATRFDSSKDPRACAHLGLPIDSLKVAWVPPASFRHGEACGWIIFAGALEGGHGQVEAIVVGECAGWGFIFAKA
ncbi:woronin body major protein [Pseudohyphozyma bogoriensis]|nr:woronin body major protein [Pseudohyphozyma bogoriensis]